MVTITRHSAPQTAVSKSARRSSPDLDAKARTYRAQLDDWVTCPSAKTPEGKAKIKQITERLDTVKHQIKASDGASPSASDPRGVAKPADQGSVPNRVGGIVDTYA